MVFSSGISIGTITALVLNLLFGRKNIKKYELNEDSNIIVA